MQRSERPHQRLPLKVELSGPLSWVPNSAGHKDLCGYTEEGRAEEKAKGGGLLTERKHIVFTAHSSAWERPCSADWLLMEAFYDWPELHTQTQVVCCGPPAVTSGSVKARKPAMLGTLFWVISTSVVTCVLSSCSTLDSLKRIFTKFGIPQSWAGPGPALLVVSWTESILG